MAQKELALLFKIKCSGMVHVRSYCFPFSLRKIVPIIFVQICCMAISKFLFSLKR